MVLPESCCPLQGLFPLPQAAAGLSPPPLRPCAPLPFHPLLGLGLLQTGLGCALLALSFGAPSLSSAPQVKNACVVWAGSLAILCGILGLTTWKRPMLLLVNLFVLLSVISVTLNVTGLILGCQGIQFVSRVPRCDLMDMDENMTCLCCEEFHSSTCTEVEAVLKLYHVKSCSATHVLLKKVLLGLSALTAVTATVCFIAAALHYLEILASRRTCPDECEIADEDHNLDPDDFVPPVPPPSYFATFNSFTPQTSHSTPVSHVISLCYIYGTRIKAVEVFCRLDPPPPYETVCSLKSSEQGSALQINGMEDVDSGEVSDRQSSQAEKIKEPSSRVSLSPSNASCVPAGVNRRTFDPLQKRSKNDPVLLHCQLPQDQKQEKGTNVHKMTKSLPKRNSPSTPFDMDSAQCETATLDVNALNALTLRKSSRALRGRLQSLIDCKSYMDTKQCVAWILEQSSCSMSPDIHDLVENIKSVLKSGDDTCPASHIIENPSVAFQTASWIAVPGELWWPKYFNTEGEQQAERRI